jgi:hypothetical protein
MKKMLPLLLAFAGLPSVLDAQLALDLETGAATFGYNDVHIPGSTGTGFSLSDDFEQRYVPYFRGRLSYTIGERHTVSALYAPFHLSSTGSFDQNVDFAGQTFAAGTETRSDWKFNSYRITYQYAFIRKTRFRFDAGLTGKVRDAEISLDNDSVSASKKNVGVVPLVRIYADWAFTEKFHLMLDADALVGGQGRAEDILLAVCYDPGLHVRLKIGYRLLEGGADTDEVYNFSAVHYAAVGATIRF